MTIKLALSIALIVFLGIGFLLITNHAGFAIRIANYLFFIIFGIVVFRVIKNEK